MFKRLALATTAIATLLVAAPAMADVKKGVDAWSRGDYTSAVKEWRQPAINGDADAQFNLGQAYKLGRGVPLDLKLAEEWYRKAASQGHLQAEDNFGLMLFQNGDRQRAMPIIEKSANRGEPRAQYVYGTALFNGDLVTKDWPRAYGFMTRSSAAGLAPASASLAQMDKFIPMDQRQRGLVFARQLEERAQRPQLALNTPSGAPSLPPGPPVSSQRFEPTYPTQPQAMPVEPVAPPSAPAVRPSREVEGPTWGARGGALPRPNTRRRGRPDPVPQPVEPEYGNMSEPLPQPPQPVEPVETYPTYPAYPNAPEQVEPQYPNGAGTDYPVPSARPPVAPRPAPPRASPPRPVAPHPAPPAVKQPAPIRAVSGGYRVQLGAFSDQNRAKALWTSLSHSVSGLRGVQPYLVKAGPVTRLQAGPFSSRNDAERVCGQVRSSAQSCLIVSQ